MPLMLSRRDLRGRLAMARRFAFARDLFEPMGTSQIPDMIQSAS